MATSCSSETRLTDGEYVFADSGARNAIRVKLAEVPDWYGRRAIVGGWTEYHGLGHVVLVDYDKGAALQYDTVRLPDRLYVYQTAKAGGVIAALSAGVAISVTFCTIT